MNRLLILLILSFRVISTNSQSSAMTGLQSINRESAEAIIEFLANDLLEGREAGVRGSRIAAEYLISCLKLFGISPYKNNYSHPFSGQLTKSLSQDGISQKNDTTVKYIPVELSMNNILGVIEGNNPEEYIIIGAHYDHLGINPELTDDPIYNGADDNASGVSAVLQIARAFKWMDIRPERSIIFAFWDGEEKGLLGSSHFIKNFPAPSKIKCYMNFDMIGRNKNEDNPTEVVYFYTRPYKHYEEWLKNDIETYQLELTPNYRPWDEPTSGSDNASFAKANVPVIWFHTDGHPDYHKPTDHSVKLNWDKIVEITKAAYLICYRLAYE